MSETLAVLSLCCAMFALCCAEVGMKTNLAARGAKIWHLGRLTTNLISGAQRLLFQRHHRHKVLFLKDAFNFS